jgi:O-antigen/teichoic acid export membrane protein
LGTNVPTRITVECGLAGRNGTVSSFGVEVADAGTTDGSAVVMPELVDVFILIASPLVRRVLRVVFVLMVARSLGPAGFGAYALLFALVEFIAVASGVGYADYLTRETAKDERVGWGAALQLTWLRIAIAIPLVAIVIAMLFILHYLGTVLESTAWMALTVAPRALTESVQGVLRGIRRYTLYLILDLVVGLTLVAGGCFLLVSGGYLKVVIATEIAAATVGGTVAFAVLLRLRTAEPIHSARGQLARKIFVFNLYPFITNLYDRVDVVLLSKLAGDYATGIYSVAYRAFGTLQLIPYGVLYSILPSVSRGKWGDDETKQLQKAMGLLLSVAYAVILATLVLAGPAVHLVLGARYVDSIPVLKILIWATIPMYLNFTLNIGLLAMGRERVFMITSAVCLTLNFIGNLVLIPMFSWRAAAALTIVTELVLLAQNTYWIRRAIGSVALPRGYGQTTLVFVVLLAGLLSLGRFISIPLAGISCFFLFLGYLYLAGLSTEFMTIWRSRGNPSI